MTFGIPVASSFPIRADGNLKRGNHVKWMSRQKAKEYDGLKSNERIDLALPTDILLGRGSIIQDHGGNVLLRNLIEKNISKYTGTSKGEKTNFIDDLVQIIRQNGGRFLKLNQDGWWVNASDKEAHSKISKMFTYLQASSARIKTPTNNATVYTPMKYNKAVNPEKRFKIDQSGDQFRCFDLCL